MDRRAVVGVVGEGEEGSVGLTVLVFDEEPGVGSDGTTWSESDRYFVTRMMEVT